MWIVEYENPYTNKIDSKKFRGRYAEDHAFSYTKERYENYYMNVPVRAYETFRGKRTGRGLTFGEVP